MFHKTKRFFGVLIVGLISTVLQAQAPAPPAPPAIGPDLAPIRARIPTEPDQRIITQWIEAQITAASGEDPAGIRNFRRAFGDQYRATGATEGFRTALAQLASRSFAQAIANRAGGAKGPALCSIMMTVLIEMNQPSAVEAALAGLSHPSDAVRDRSAKCLTQLAGKLSEGDVTKVVAAAQAAGGKENQPLALREIYRLLAAGGKPEDSVKAICAIVQTRLAAYKARDVRACRGDAAAAEAIAAYFSGNARSQITQATAKMALQRMAELLTAAVLNYIADPPEKPDDRAYLERQDNLEITIDAVEKALVAVAKSQKDSLQPAVVADKLKQAGAGRNADMQLELNKWIGTSSTPGLLNAAPFSLPVGLPDIKLAPPQTPNAATTKPAG